jgi:hypothetical protein
MRDAMPVSMSQSLGQLAHHLHPLLRREAAQMLCNPQVKSLLGRVSIEQHRRAALGLHELSCVSDALVTKSVKKSKLALSLPTKTRFLLFRGCGPGQVHPDASGDAHARPLPNEVLPARAFVEQFADGPVADSATAVGGLDAGLLDGIGNPLRQRLVDGRAAKVQYRRVAEGGNDARQLSEPVR